MKKKLLALAAWGVLAGAAWAQGSGTLEKISASGVVNLGVRDSSGLAYALGNGKYAGFHIEMAERIVADLSKQLGKPLKINYQPMTSQNRMALVKNGVIDFECSSTTHTKARQKEVDFALTTYVDETRVAVRADSGIQKLADLNGKTVAVTTGSTSVQHLRRQERSQGLEFREIMGKDHADSFLLLESGRADAFVRDGVTLARSIAMSQNPQNFKILSQALAAEPIACMLRKGDDKFREAIDASIRRQMADGSLQKLHEKYLMQPVAPAQVSLNIPLSKSVKQAWAHPNRKPAEDDE